MSKQDGYSPRTAADLERKYNFGKSFAEIYGLASDARSAAIEAQNAYEGLTTNEIFNLLTDFGESQGVYRDDTGNVYVNASFIKSGKLEGTDLKVAAAIVEGELSAATITADKISGGELDFNKVTARGLEVTMAQISDLSSLKITTQMISGTTLDFTNVIAQNLRTDALYTGSYYQHVDISDGSIKFYSGNICDDAFGCLNMSASKLVLSSSYDPMKFYMPDGSYWELSPSGMAYYNSSGYYVGQMSL